MQNLFVYGSLMCKDILAAVAGSVFPHRPALLHDYGRYKMRKEQYPGIVLMNGSVVNGLVYRDVSPQGWERLDRFEGDMYVRCRVVVRYPDATRGAADCYIVKPEYRKMLTNEPWEFETFLRQGKKIFLDRYVGFNNIVE